MKTNKIWEPLRLFGAEAEGETQQRSDPTPQIIENSGEAQVNATPAAGEGTEGEAREKGFRALMEGEYKDLFSAYFQETFNRRFKEQKEIKAELQRANALLEQAATYFGVEKCALSDTIRAESEKKNASADDGKGESARQDAVAEDTVREAVEKAVREARAEAEQRLLCEIRARGLRPSESALSDVTADAARGRGRLSKEQRAEVARRAAKGERIEF